tara:strand:+ start:434 stop:763 length:330 start_codon:yes stop_codon:yes gene_type:complete
MTASRTTILKAQRIMDSDGVSVLETNHFGGDEPDLHIQWEVRDTSTNRVSVDGGGYVCYKEPYASNDLCMGWKLGNKGVAIEDRTCKHIEAVKMFRLIYSKYGRRDIVE